MKLKTLKPAMLSSVALTFGIGSVAHAGGPLANCSDGVPFLWPAGGANIEVNLDLGNLGPFNNAQADAFIDTALQEWTDIDTATISYTQGADLPFDIDSTNFGPVLNQPAPNGVSEIVYDADGSIFTAIFGPGSGVLGFAGPDFGNPTTCELLEGSAFLNGPEFAIGDPNNLGIGIVFHEFGHFNNLAHTQTNGAILLGDTTGPSPNNSFGVPALDIFFDAGANEPTNALDTMYPFVFSNSPDLGTSTPALSDTTSLSALYPTPDYFDDTATISGAVLLPDGVTRVSGVNVIARNVDDPFEDAVSALSGESTDISDPNASPFVGTFVLTGLTPGATYQLYIDEIVDGGFSTSPMQPLLGPEEFYSGGSESDFDDPQLAASVTVAAGVTTSGIDIIINSPQPGDPLPTGQFGDLATELALPFPFDFCGVRHNTVFVNGNGNVSFGTESTDFSESASDHLTGPPRIAGFWDDLNSSAGGILTFDTDRATFFKLIWRDVPEFLGSVGANNFSITLLPKNDGSSASERGNPFELEYGSLTARDGLAGYSCGGALTSNYETETDFAGKNTLNSSGTALYEQWTSSSLSGENFDLTGETRRFNGVAGFSDAFERLNDDGVLVDNNSIANATSIELPFHSANRISTIEPGGNDVDYFSFSAEAGDIFAIEVVRGGLDSLIGLFDADTGDLLILDDDGGAGLLSRLLIQVSVDANLALAVTTFPDGGFTGAGASGGRYVLSVQRYQGDLLFLGDDDSAEISLPFSFPFQGAQYNSVFVNSNGNLTFGAGDTDFSESVGEFLSGAPRIAVLWDDLNPAGAIIGNDGLFVIDHDDDSTTIHGVSVSEFFSSTPNYFSVELDEDGEVELTYGATARSDALVGVTEGGGAADPGQTDLSKADDDELEKGGTIYQNFPSSPTTTTPFSDFDLFFDDLEFEQDD